MEVAEAEAGQYVRRKQYPQVYVIANVERDSGMATLVNYEVPQNHEEYAPCSCLEMARPDDSSILHNVLHNDADFRRQCYVSNILQVEQTITILQADSNYFIG